MSPAPDRRGAGCTGRHVLAGAARPSSPSCSSSTAAMIYAAMSTFSGGDRQRSPIARACITTSASAPTSARRARRLDRDAEVGCDGHAGRCAASPTRRTAAPVRGLQVDGAAGPAGDEPRRREARAHRDGAGRLRGADGGLIAGASGLIDLASRCARPTGARADLPRCSSASMSGIAGDRP